jgi:hypothetical protein
VSILAKRWLWMRREGVYACLYFVQSIRRCSRVHVRMLPVIVCPCEDVPPCELYHAHDTPIACAISD